MATATLADAWKGDERGPRSRAAKRKSAKAAKKPGRPAEGGKFDDATAPTHLAFEFGVRNGRGEFGRDEWRSEVRIISAEAWEAEEVRIRREWASKALDDGRIMLCRLVPPREVKKYHRDDHYPPAASTVRGFRARLLDWLEAQPDVADDVHVVLNGGGACTVTFGVPNDVGGHEAVDLVLRHNEELGEL